MLKTTKLTSSDKLPLTCTRTGTCCHGKNVNLNPWELHCLAKAKKISPKEFRDLYCEFGGIRLRFDGTSQWKNLSACNQYIEGFGCSVHEGRPLACRLYPLGRQKQADKTTYIFQGTNFPCLEDCPDVVNLPQMSVKDYIKGQAAEVFETVQDEYLEVMQNIADIAFVLLLETGLSASGDRNTLRRWKILGNLTPEQLTAEIETDWMETLMLPELKMDLTASEFISQHNELLQQKAQDSFGLLNTNQKTQDACCLFIAMALHLSRGLGANPSELAEHWVNTAKEHGALD